MVKTCIIPRKKVRYSKKKKSKGGHLGAGAGTRSRNSDLRLLGVGDEAKEIFTTPNAVVIYWEFSMDF
jgi:hypothetical protein